MSADAGPTTTRRDAAYDASEIRGRIAVCFTAAELRQLAEALGADGVAHDRGIGEAARQLVRHFERRGSLAPLVERLREARPLVEWPEPLPDAAPFDEDAETTVIRPLVGSYAPPPAPPPAEAPLVDPYAPPAAGLAWPGTAPTIEPPPARGLDPRILLAVAGLMVLAVAGAYLAGRASTPPASPAPTASASARSRRPGGPATRAADAIARALESVARACEIQPGPAGDLMPRAFVRCGPAPLAPKPPARAAPAAADAPPEPSPPSTRPLPPPGAPATPAEPGNARCLSSCAQQQKACNASQCGGEPTEGSKYKAYQDCLGKCLVDASRCRLSCQ